MPLAELPSHSELYRQVLELGGGVTEEIWRPIFEAMLVAELPPPHNPANCRHITRFRRMTASAHDHETAARAFLATLAAADLAACRFHQARWRAIAEESVAILKRVGRVDGDEYVAAARAARLPDSEKRWLASLFEDPIIVGEGHYTNGQHRACALRFSGAERAAVVTGDELVGTQSGDWVYEGEG